MNAIEPFAESLIWPIPSEALPLPHQFPDPFHLPPHHLALACAEELQRHLDIFFADELARSGKMFGVLAVETPDGERGFLAAFSGSLMSRSRHPAFVPPVFDLHDETLFFKRGEKEISALNDKIHRLENSETFILAKETVNRLKSEWEEKIGKAKEQMVIHKKIRDEKRSIQGQPDETISATEQREKLNQESAREKSEFRKLKQQAESEIRSAEKQLDNFRAELDRLKKIRRDTSARLQDALFAAYLMLNGKGEEKNITSIFADAGLFIPPGGSGDCAAPKLFQFALKHRLKPLAMAEFWWGAAPADEIRKHGHYYPPCRGKCEPILGFMLQGIPMEKTTVRGAEPLPLPVLFEDEYLLAVNKPEGLLSVPGKGGRPSAAGILGSGYIPVHRLDMDTSGILLFAKSAEVHQKLQKMFAHKTVEKSYIALLDGVLTGMNGGLISLPLRTDLEDRPRQRVCHEFGKPAHTRWKILGMKENRTRIQFMPITGRTHQLRVHAAHPKGLNLPILGDRLYGNSAKRLYLHAEKLRFTHPITGKICLIEAPCEF